ncbi:11193_t:CDS:2 [Ambispora gerdemannii]|uniref:11193_t:CDS:1 n=1 Tax=Ambispora gerdemannii TaxID=144530 RepID=A0A9N8Z2P5_9GLOM|nr:11193_t:CDS:2 [Ambispora gerdemannii]
MNFTPLAPELEQLITTLFTESKCACHVINPHKTRVLMWQEKKDDQTTYHLRIGIQKFIAQAQTDRNGEKEANKEEEKPTNLDFITKFQQRQEQAKDYGKPANNSESAELIKLLARIVKAMGQIDKAQVLAALNDSDSNKYKSLKDREDGSLGTRTTLDRIKLIAEHGLTESKKKVNDQGELDVNGTEIRTEHEFGGDYTKNKNDEIYTAPGATTPLKFTAADLTNLLDLVEDIYNTELFNNLDDSIKNIDKGAEYALLPVKNDTDDKPLAYTKADGTDHEYTLDIYPQTLAELEVRAAELQIEYDSLKGEMQDNQKEIIKKRKEIKEERAKVVDKKKIIEDLAIARKTAIAKELTDTHKIAQGFKKVDDANDNRRTFQELFEIERKIKNVRFLEHGDEEKTSSVLTNNVTVLTEIKEVITEYASNGFVAKKDGQNVFSNTATIESLIKKVAVFEKEADGTTDKFKEINSGFLAFIKGKDAKLKTLTDLFKEKTPKEQKIDSKDKLEDSEKAKFDEYLYECAIGKIDESKLEKPTEQQQNTPPSNDEPAPCNCWSGPTEAESLEKEETEEQTSSTSEDD